MPKVKMITSMAGLNFSYQFGDEVDVPDEVAKAWIEAEIAVHVEDPTVKGDA